jgi:hypothetical protein
MNEYESATTSYPAPALTTGGEAANGGIVYILTNEAMPGYIKIGKTGGEVASRIRQLDNTSVPLPFEVFYARRVSDAGFVERRLHNAFADTRVRKLREFFTVDPERVKAALEIAPGEEVVISESSIVEDAEDLSAIEKAKSRKRHFDFLTVGIERGAVLCHKNDSSVTCEVYDSKRVIFEDEVMSISKAAGIVLERMGLSPRVAGPMYWMLDGRTLRELQEELEADY